MISTKEKFKIYKPKKFLGQNFLVDENIAKKIVSSLDIVKDDTVVEIGPGQGVLTKYLAEGSENFFAVEIDKSLIENLSLKFKGRAKIIHKNFLKLNLQKEFPGNTKLKVIGNIPYNLTSEILFKLFDSSDAIDMAVLMMQKEVARRLIARHNTKEYGILSIQTQLHTTPEILFNVSPTSFFPKPLVTSSIVKLDFNKKIESNLNKNLFKTLVKESFGKRRKTMKNSLKNFFESNKIGFDKIDFDFSRRAESVTVEEFIKLTKEIEEIKSS